MEEYVSKMLQALEADVDDDNAHHQKKLIPKPTGPEKKPKRKRKRKRKTAEAKIDVKPQDQIRQEKERKKIRKEDNRASLKKLEVRNTIQVIEPETVKEYELSKDTKKYMLETLKSKQATLGAQDVKEAELISNLPSVVDNLAYLESLGEQVKFHTNGINALVIEGGYNIPDIPVYSKEYIDQFLCQPTPGRDRPCRMGNNCVCLRHFGFICREFPRKEEYEAFLEARKTMPDSALDQFSSHYPCYICELSDYLLEHVRRASIENNRDPSHMPDGTVKDIPIDKLWPINRFQVWTGKPGQYNPFQCLGIGDQHYTNIWGAIPQFRPSHYIRKSRLVVNPITRQDITQAYLVQKDDLLFGDGVTPGVTHSRTPSSR